MKTENVIVTSVKVEPLNYVVGGSGSYGDNMVYAGAAKKQRLERWDSLIDLNEMGIELITIKQQTFYVGNVNIKTDNDNYNYNFFIIAMNGWPQVNQIWITNLPPWITIQSVAFHRPFPI